ncbi:MAG: polysaccharide pyruvyl transferase family protein [Agriterribacter sp.]
MSGKSKIGILTHFNVCNFGANLQAFSTASYFRNIGYEPVFIKWEAYQKNLLTNISLEQLKAHQNWIDENLSYTNACFTDEDIQKVIKNEGIQAVVVGSDAVLTYRPLLYRFGLSKTGIKYKKQNADYLFPNPHWLSFLDSSLNVPAALMSPSNQNSVYPLIKFSLRKKMGDQLKKFSYVSARDNWTRQMIEYLRQDDKSIPVTPDPVFAFNQNVKQNVTREEILAKFNLPDKYVLVSFHKEKDWMPSPEWINGFKAALNKEGYACVGLPMPKGYAGLKVDQSIQLPLSPIDWYNLIRFSNGFVGHLMHSIIVSLHNQVPFFSFDNYGFKILKYFQDYRSSKIYDILKLADLLENWQMAKKIGETSPKLVADRILNFRKDKCAAFADKRLSDYNIMMQDIINALGI